jgi:hypothetical protein
LRWNGEIEYQVAGKKSGTSAAATMEDLRVDLECKIFFIQFLFVTLEQWAPIGLAKTALPHLGTEKQEDAPKANVTPAISVTLPNSWLLSYTSRCPETHPPSQKN